MCPVKVPPRRERAEDIPALISHFTQRYAAKIGKLIDKIPDHVPAVLQRYHWPGNIRELQNVIERAVIVAQDGTLRADEALETRSPISVEAQDHRTLEAVERDHILGVLEQTGWRIEGESGAAIVLGLHPNTLRSRMKKLEIAKKTGPA